MTIGIDKIQLRVKDAGQKRQTNHLQREGWARGNTWIQTEEGLHVLQKATFYAKDLKTDGYMGNLTIKDEPLADTTWIQFNPTNFFSDYKLTTDVKGAINKAQDIVWSSGLDIDLSCADITRIDITKDRVLTEPVQRYAPTLQQYLHFKRQSNKRAYEDGLTLGNNSRQFTFYDRKLKLDLESIDNDLASNTARLEYKLLNAGRKTWSNTYNIHNAKDLTNDIDQYNTIYQDGLRNLMLKDVIDGNTINLSPITLVNQLKQYKTLYGRNFTDYYLKDYGLLYIIDQFGTEIFIDALAQVTDAQTKEVRRKIKKGISSALQLSQSIKEHKRPVEYVQEIFEQYAKAS